MLKSLLEKISSNHRPKVPYGNMNAKKTRKYRNIRVWIQVTLYDKGDNDIPCIWTQFVNTHKMLMRWTKFISSAYKNVKNTWKSNSICEHKSRFRMTVTNIHWSAILSRSWHTVNCNGGKIELARNSSMETCYDIPPCIHWPNLHLLWNVIKWNVIDLDFFYFLSQDN